MIRRRVELRRWTRAGAGVAAADGVREAERAVRLAVGGAHLVADVPQRRAVAGSSSSSRRQVDHRHACRADELVAEERHLRLDLELHQLLLLASAIAVEVERERRVVPVRVLAAVGVGRRLLAAAAEGHRGVERRLLERDEGPDAAAGDGADGDALAADRRHGRLLGFGAPGAVGRKLPDAGLPALTVDLRRCLADLRIGVTLCSWFLGSRCNQFADAFVALMDAI